MCYGQGLLSFISKLVGDCYYQSLPSQVPKTMTAWGVAWDFWNPKVGRRREREGKQEGREGRQALVA